MIPTRQLCKRCFKYSPLTFFTPDEIWKQVTDDRYQHLCLPCFIDMADERLIEWKKGLRIHPVSLVEQRATQEQVARGEYRNEFLEEWTHRVTSIDPNHPESFCQQCGGANPCWYICPVCFQKECDEKGITIIFKVEQ